MRRVNIMFRSTLAIAAFGAGAVDALCASPPTARAIDQAPQRDNNLSADRQPARVGNPLWDIPLAALKVTQERPLFSATRRTAPPAIAAMPAPLPAPAPPEQPPEPDQPPLSLVGTIVRDREGIAIFQRGGADDFIRLKIGESFAGWNLADIKPKAATLKKGDRDATLGFLPPVSAQQPTMSPLAAATPAWLNGAKVTAVSPHSSAPSGQGQAPAWLNGTPFNVRLPGPR